MKYDEMNVSSSYNYESDNVSRGKITKKHKYNPLDIALIGSICAVVVSSTVLISRLMSSGIINSALSMIG